MAISSSPTLAADQNIAPAQTISKSPGMYAGSVAVGPSGEVSHSMQAQSASMCSRQMRMDLPRLCAPSPAQAQLDGAVQIAVDSVYRAYVTISTDPGKVLALPPVPAAMWHLYGSSPQLG